MSDDPASTMPPLAWINVLIASSFFVIDFAISARLQLQLIQPLIISATRCLLQLTIMGFILDDLFRRRDPLFMSGYIVVLMLLTAWEVSRNKTRYWFHGIFLAVFVSTLVGFCVVGVLGIRFAIGPQYFRAPEVCIPTAGLLLGMTASTMAVAVNAFIHGVGTTGDAQILAMLAMGATRWEASRNLTRAALRMSMLPNIQRMSIAGLITIPGAMSGQILGGANIGDAVRYQQVVLFMISACACLACITLLTICRMVFLDSHHRLRIERIQHSKRFCHC
ncbi:UPF0014 family [Gongronella butleri]|nr:UPF0014 family [Gongronella butleri]